MSLSVIFERRLSFCRCFGTAVMLLDTPGTPRWAGVHRNSIRKHARFLTRLTGKSLFLFYLGMLQRDTLSGARADRLTRLVTHAYFITGCTAMSCLWPKQRATSSSFLVFLAFFLGSFVNIVALLGLLMVNNTHIKLWYK